MNKTISLDDLNAMSRDDAHNIFFNCCHSSTWAQAMADARPFESPQTVLEIARSKWQTPTESDILDAFSGHAKIGDLNALRSKYASAEQGQITQTTDAVLTKLKELNEEYFDKFGFIFIVCATGKPATHMLEILQQRIHNSREQELKNGAQEQRKITHIRLKNLLGIS